MVSAGHRGYTLTPNYVALKTPYPITNEVC